jgi:hypothetical protein
MRRPSPAAWDGLGGRPPGLALTEVQVLDVEAEQLLGAGPGLVGHPPEQPVAAGDAVERLQLGEQIPADGAFAALGLGALAGLAPRSPRPD